ncbi:MAG: hypothetical protein ACI4S3_09335 [Candidatus Gastranaerophilaceae bacterium]
MYNLFYATNNENNSQYGYVLMKDKVVLKEVYFDKDKMAYTDIVNEKINFLTEVLKDFPEINWKRLLITLVARDDDIVEFYKQIFYKTDYCVPQERTETFDYKITPDEKLYLDVCLKDLRQKLGT